MPTTRMQTLRAALPLTLLLACGGGGDDTTAGDSTTGSTTSPETTNTPDDTTGTPTTTDDSASSSTGPAPTTTGEPAVCDGFVKDNAFDCTACTECGTWTDPPPAGSYPDAMTCMLEGLRDGAIVGANTESCSQGLCLNGRLLATRNGTVISQSVIYNQNDQSMMYQGIQELPVKDTAFFEACLAAYDPNCASTNTWFAGAALDLTEVTCP